MSAGLFDTFGNEVGTRITQGKVEQFLKNSTINFVLPEAASQLLAEFAPQGSVDKPLFDAVVSKLVTLGFKEANAKAMASVLLPVAEEQGISPMDFFTDQSAALKLAQDTYDALNLMRPAGNLLGLKLKVSNRKSKLRTFITP